MAGCPSTPNSRCTLGAADLGPFGEGGRIMNDAENQDQPPVSSNFYELLGLTAAWKSAAVESRLDSTSTTTWPFRWRRPILCASG